MWSGIKKTYVRLVEEQDSTALLDHLYQDDVFTSEDCNTVRAEQVSQKKNRKLLQILEKKADESHYKYVVALKNSGQEHLANLIWGENLGEDDRAHAVDGAKPVDATKRKSQQALRRNSNQLSDKLQDLFCLGGDGLETDIYPYLVCNGLGSSASSTFLNNDFTFLHFVPWKVIFEFEELGTTGDPSIYKYFADNLQAAMNVRFVDEFDASKKGEENLEETIKNSCVPIWLFSNGYEDLNRPVLSAKDWRRQYSEGFKEALRMVCRQAPRDRVVVVFLLLSENYNVMLTTFEEFSSKFQDNWLLIAESDQLCSKWKDELIRRDLTDEQAFKEHSVIGMSWSHINCTFRSLFNGKTPKLKDIPSSSGTKIPLILKFENSLTDLEILGSSDITNVAGLADKYEEGEFTELVTEEGRDAEEKFYRGEQVSWSNFFFKTHVMRRDLFSKINKRVEELLVGTDVDEDKRVGHINLYHQPAAGGSTLAREVLWEHKSQNRCAVVKHLSDKTVDQIFKLRGYEEEYPEPMILLLDNFEPDQVAFFMDELVREAKPYDEGGEEVLFVLLICYRKSNLQFSMNENTFKLYSKLSPEELTWIHKKWEQLDKDYEQSKQRNPRNFISFNTLKENFNKGYIEKTVQELVSQIDRPQERKLLKYISIINTFDLQVRSLPISSFDSIMSERRWEKSASGPLRMLLNEVSGQGFSENRSVRIINSLLAEHVFKVLCCSSGDKGSSENEGTVMIELLNSKIFAGKSLDGPSEKLLKTVRTLMKTRAKKTSGMSVTKFAPLIQAIVDDRGQSISVAAEVLELVFQLSDDPFVAQQIARLYIHSKNWIEAKKYGEMITTQSGLRNSFLWDTYAQIFKCQLIEKYHESLEKKLMPDNSSCDSLKIGFKAIEMFRQVQQISEKEFKSWNNAGYHGEIETAARMMDLMHSIIGLDDISILRSFLIDQDFVPRCVAGWDGELITKLKNLPRTTEQIFNKLDDENLQLKTEYIDESERKISYFQEDLLMRHRECINAYLCEDSADVPSEFTLDQKCHFWRRRITRLRGNTLKLLFDIRRSESAVKTLNEIRASAKLIIDTGHPEPRDLQVYIGASIVLCTLGATEEIHELELIEFSRRLYNTRHQSSMNELEPYMYAFMLNWPGSPTASNVQFPINILEDIMMKWKDSFLQKHPRTRDERRRETTFFFLSKGTGILRYVYEGQLQGGHNRIRNAKFWNSDHVSSQLETIQGVLEHNGCAVRVTLRSKGNQFNLFIPTSLPMRNSELLHKEVYFYLGFTWSGPKAYNVRASCIPLANPARAANFKENKNHSKREENSRLTFYRSTSMGFRGPRTISATVSTAQPGSSAEMSQSPVNMQFNEKMKRLDEEEKAIRQQIYQEKKECGRYSYLHSSKLREIHIERNKLIEQQRRNTKGVEFGF